MVTLYLFAISHLGMSGVVLIAALDETHAEQNRISRNIR